VRAQKKPVKLRPDQTLLQVDRFSDRLLTYEEPDLAKCSRFFAELSIATLK
jgi:hypothetical protein